MSFDTNDVVVCVSLDSPCCGDPEIATPRYPQPVLRATYRVTDVGVAECNRCGREVLAFLPAPHTAVMIDWAWPQACFTKIEPSSEDIFLLADQPMELV
jgi:hypothetical protein